MWMAFPSADYYGGSVAIGLVPRRQSRVSCLLDVQNGLGAHFVPLRLLIVTGLPWSMFKPGRSERPVIWEPWVSTFVSRKRSLHLGYLGSCSLAFPLPFGSRWAGRLKVS